MRKLTLALLLSVLCHGMIFFFFLLPTCGQKPPTEGRVAIELVSQFHHGEDSTKGTKSRRSAPPVKSPSNVSAPTATKSSVDHVTQEYLLGIRDIVDRNKKYPRESLRRGEHGRVVLGITIEADGEIAEIHIEESSGASRLDHAAIETLRRVKKFPPLPPGSESPQHVHIPISFQIHSTNP